MPKISELPPDIALDGAEIVPLTGGGATARTTVSAIRDFTFAEFGANTFPARASTGALEDKPITDFALSLLDDANAAAARATLGAGTVTSVAATQPPAGMAISGSPITGAGTLAFTLANDLLAVENLSTSGSAHRIAADTWAVRTLTGPAAGVSVTNGDGVAGNPTIALANDLAAVEGLSTSGSAHRIGTDSWAVRTLQGTSGRITVTNGNGVSGDPTINIPTTLIDSGTYTPTGTNVGNASVITPQVTQYSRVGNTVFVSGQVNVTPTATGAVVIRLTLPIASALASNFQLCGSGANLETNPTNVAIYGDAGTDRAELAFTAGTTSLRSVHYTFGYTVI